MVCDTADAVRQIRRIGDDAYGLRMVLLSIAQSDPELIVRAIHQVKGEEEKLEAALKDVLKREGKFQAIKFYIKRTGVSLDYAAKRVNRVKIDW